MRRVLVGVVTTVLLLGAAVTGVALLREDAPVSSETCQRLPRDELPRRGETRLGDRLDLLVPGSDAEHVGTARVIHVGDPGVGQIAAAVRSGGCTHTVWWPGGTRMSEARRWLRAR